MTTADAHAVFNIIPKAVNATICTNGLRINISFNDSMCQTKRLYFLSELAVSMQFKGSFLHEEELNGAIFCCQETNSMRGGSKSHSTQQKMQQNNASC